MNKDNKDDENIKIFYKNRKSKNIAVEVTIPEEPTFEVAGAAPALAAGHLD